MAWIAIVLVAAIAVALLRGGTLRNLADIPLRAWWLLVFGAAMQVAAGLLPDDQTWSTRVGVGLILFSYIPLFAVALLNRAQPGMWLAGVGILMNFTVISLNGGMPVLPEAAVLAGAESSDLVLNAKHVVLDEGTRLVFLADVIPLRFLGQVISVGDVFLALGLGQFLEGQLRRPTRYFRRTGTSRPGSAAGQ